MLGAHMTPRVLINACAVSVIDTGGQLSLSLCLSLPRRMARGDVFTHFVSLGYRWVGDELKNSQWLRT